MAAVAGAEGLRPPRVSGRRASRNPEPPCARAFAERAGIFEDSKKTEPRVGDRPGKGTEDSRSGVRLRLIANATCSFMRVLRGGAVRRARPLRRGGRWGGLRRGAGIEGPRSLRGGGLRGGPRCAPEALRRGEAPGALHLCAAGPECPSGGRWEGAEAGATASAAGPGGAVGATFFRASGIRRREGMKSRPFRDGRSLLLCAGCGGGRGSEGRPGVVTRGGRRGRKVRPPVTPCAGIRARRVLK